MHVKILCILPNLQNRRNATTRDVGSLKYIAKLDVELTTEERNLLRIGCKNVMGARRESWRTLSSIEERERAKGNEGDAKRIEEYRRKVESELTSICNDIIQLIDDHLLPSTSLCESCVFYHRMKGDYFQVSSRTQRLASRWRRLLQRR
uniref:14-3-3 brain family protein n=1 Tax=Populus alba TaxID=43335 RepID=A0A4U5P6A6_POPAL|nr:14-3-3 brain family protein [Populus alba]